jgi:glycosyltransferase involved in cell wall biosynthesis
VGFARLFSGYVLLHPRCSLSALYWERRGLWRWIFRQVIRLTDGVIGLSSEWDQLPKIVPGIRVHILHNAINLSPYIRIARNRLDNFNLHNEDEINILYLGNLGHAKGSYDLLEAAQKIKRKGLRIFFRLVGDELQQGELDELLRSIAKAKLNSNVSIHSPVVGKEKLACFRNADIFVYPSYSEGLPMAVIEAMASGLPIVSTNVGGLPDLVQDGVNGLMVEPGCPDELADALLKIISNPKLRQSMQEKSAQIASDNYDLEQHVHQLLEIYHALISENRKSN